MRRNDALPLSHLLRIATVHFIDIWVTVCLLDTLTLPPLDAQQAHHAATRISLEAKRRL